LKQLNENRWSFVVQENLQPFVQDAIERLSYLFPSVCFIQSGQSILLEADEVLDITEMNREVAYTLYRSKIRIEGAPNRTALYKTVFGK